MCQLWWITKLVTTLSIIIDTLLKVALNISKTVHHVVHFIADNLLKVALNTNKTSYHVIHHNCNNVSIMMNNVVTSFIGI
jgi:hypothetical protein